MEILKDPEFKTMYQKYKIRVKLWESRFTEKNGRKPNKNDIKDADIKIKESYKMYWKLKTRALEETLTDIMFDDETQDTVENKAETGIEETKDVDNKPLRDDNGQLAETACDRNMKDTEQKDIDVTEKKDLNDCVEKCSEMLDKENTENIDPKSGSSLPLDDDECKNVKGVWGEHLSKANEQIPKKKETLFIGRSSSFQLSQNKFTNTSFTKRNPRKSLSMSKIRTKSEKEDTVNTNSPVQMMNTNANVKHGVDVEEEAKPIFGDPVKVTYTESKSLGQSLSSVQQVMEGHTISRNLNPGWLDRCAKQNNLEYTKFDPKRLSGTSDSGIESMESSIYSPKEIVPPSKSIVAVRVSDEEDFVYNSDVEEEYQSKRIRNLKKRFSDEDVNPSKKMCFAKDTSFPVMSKLEAQSKIINITSAQDKTEDTSDIHDTKKNSVVSNEHLQANLPNTTHKMKIEEKSVLAVSRSKQPNDESQVEKTRPSKERTTRKVRRRIKHVSSDDSDPDFTDEDKQEKKSTKKSTNVKGAPARKKKEAANKPATRNKKKVEGKSQRSSRMKKDLQDEKDTLEPGPADAEAEGDEEPTVYSIETLEAIPRFAMRKDADGNLIEKFAKSVSLETSTTNTTMVPGKPKQQLSEKEKLEKKIADGKINENFVRINLKKKVYVRGKKHFNFSKYKKNQWKQRKKELGSGEGSLEVADFIEKNKGVLKCFKCGDVGHFSRRCPNSKGDDLIPLNQIDESSEFPTLEEAQQMASQDAVVAHAKRIENLPQKPSYVSEKDIKLPESEEEEVDNTEDNDLWEPIDDEEILCGHKIPEDLVQKLLPPAIGTVQSLYPNHGHLETPVEVFETLRKFGHESFRPGQEKAVMRILSGHSTLVTLSTGSGKSLCYQLPAYLYSKHFNCITLVISPLVSLMDDQVTSGPSFLSAACLHTNQTQKVRDTVMERVKQGKVNILLISPEAAVAGEKSTGFGALLRQLPPIAFACIDEAHCISQWSHNFRPSYLMVCRVLREKLHVRTILALTATATKSTAESIVNYLGVPDGMAGVISDIPMPRNLILSVSRDINRDEALIDLLQSKRFNDCNSIIVYCTRREECVRIAGLLRACLQNTTSSSKVNSKISAVAEAYHAGLSAYRRKIVQNAFMNGETRVVVATVAFGMGINKADIRAVIHYNMPGTFEGYVQEVGRAGRDGLLAHCHLFLSQKEDDDKRELRRHIYADGIDRHTIRRLLEKVFVPCACAKLREKDSSRRCPGHEVAIPVDETVTALDISAEIILTLLCYLELHPKRFITVLSSVYVKARVSSYGGPQALKQAAQNSPPLAMAIALDMKNGISHENDSLIEFPVVDITSAIGWDSGVVKSHLKGLEWKTVNGVSKRSAISVRYDTLGLRVKAPGDLTPVELDEALDALVSRAQNQEVSALRQLETINATLHKFSMPIVEKCSTLTEDIHEKSDELKNVIRKYFSGEFLLDCDLTRLTEVDNEADIVNDIRNLIVNYRDTNFTGRAIARIFHGIQSPNYPAYVWNRCRFWRAHLSCNFNALCRIATREILALR